MTPIKNNLRLMKLITTFLLLVGLMSACGQEEANTSNAKSSEIEIGTDIKDVVKESSGEKNSDDVRKLIWDDLIPKGFEPDRMIKKYRDQLDSLQDGTAEAQELLSKIVNEFNNAPSNAELDGKMVKIPGFIAPLDETNGMVSEFLLVPYFGSCIHSPPPPVNQTVLVETLRDESIPIEKIYQPFWIIGKMQVKQQDTDLAKAGYVIQDAKLEVFKDEEESVTVPNLTE